MRKSLPGANKVLVSAYGIPGSGSVFNKQTDEGCDNIKGDHKGGSPDSKHDEGNKYKCCHQVPPLITPEPQMLCLK